MTPTQGVSPVSTLNSGDFVRVATPASDTSGGSAASAGNVKEHSKINGIIQQLQKLNYNPQQVWLEALREYQEIALDRWPLPVGYRSRVAPEYFSKVYGAPRTAVEYGQKWVEDHHLSGCSWSRGYLDALACADRLLLNDRSPGIVNSTSLEYLARKAYGFEAGFALVRQESDWRKPRNAGKDWSTKVDFEIIRRIDPGIQSDFMGGEYMRDTREEMRVEMGRDADFAKVQLKLGQRTDITDPLNQA